jgi:copper transport protein
VIPGVARWRRAAALAAAVSVAVLGAAPALPWVDDARVAAHAQLVASSPGAGAVLDEAPAEVRLIFSEPLEAQYTSLDMVGGGGRTVLTRAGEIDPDDPHALVASLAGLAALEDGVYQVTWRTLSAADGHTAEGSFTFGVGRDVAGVPMPGAAPMTHADVDLPRVAARWLTYIGLLVAVGAAAFHAAVIRAGRMPRALVRILAAGLALSAVATLGLATLSGLEAGSVADYVLGSRNGVLQMARALVSGLGAAALLAMPARISPLVAAATGLAGIALLVVGGHAAAVPGAAPVLGQAVHVAAAAVWIGGIAGLLAVLVRPALVTADGTRPSMRTFVPRFSALALVSIGLVGVTGVYAAWVQTGTLVTTDTDYGRTLLLKSAFALGALGLGAVNFIDGGRMLGWLSGMRARLTLEGALIATVLLFTAVLAITPPNEYAGGVAVEPVPDAFGEVTPDIHLSVVPGRPGVNRVVVRTSQALAAGAPTFELALDSLDTGATSRVPLAPPGMAGMDHSDGLAGMLSVTDDGLVEWTAEAVVLPPESAWDTSVVLLGRDGTELTRQRFSFTLDEAAIAEGRRESLLDPGFGAAAVLFVAGALGVGMGLGGMTLPRCEPIASRLALVGGGAVAAVLGSTIAASRLIG